MNIIPRKNLERLAFIFVLVMSLLGIYYSRTDLKFYESSYCGEDGPIEWLTVVALFAGMVMSIYRAKILAPFRSKKFVYCLYFAAFIFFFGMMEEISWGQRIFDYPVPVFFQKYNTQGETNFHNLYFGSFKVNKIIFGSLLGIGVVFYFLVLPVLYKKMENVKEKVNSWALPLPRFYHIIAYIVLGVLVQFIDGGKKGEILEFGGSWIVFLMVAQPFNREIFSRKMMER